MTIVERAYQELTGNKPRRKLEIKYSKRFNPYNANIKYNSRRIEFGFSHRWEEVDEEIQVGLAQHLLRKALKIKGTTTNIRLYEKFIEQLPKYIDNSGKAPEILRKSFDKVNERYFDGLLDPPGLEWGRRAVRQLGRYSYHTDTVRISSIFQNLPDGKQWMLDYVMYHELLHKKFGLQHTENGNCRHHTKEFREMERKFHVNDAEKKLNSFVKRAKLRNIFK